MARPRVVVLAVICVIAAAGIACTTVLTVATQRYQAELSSLLRERRFFCRGVGASLSDSTNYTLYGPAWTENVALIAEYCLPPDQAESVRRLLAHAVEHVLLEDHETAYREFLEVGDVLRGEPVPRLKPKRLPLDHPLVLQDGGVR